MSVLIEYSMFPTDKGESVSIYVSKIIEFLKHSGYKHSLTAMGTIIETETLKEALEIIENSYLVLEPFSNRVYASINLDIRKNLNNRILNKITSINNIIGKNNIE